VRLINSRPRVAHSFLRIIGITILVTAHFSQMQAATLVVTSTADSGPGTLRAALSNAVAHDVITFSLSTPATITLTNGELLVPSVTIIGPGPANLTVSGGNSSSIFHIGSTSNANISGLTIANGFVSGGGVGGGIYNEQGTLTLTNCVVTNSQAVSSGGGGIYNDHAVLMATNCVISNNRSSNGGGINNNQSMLTITNSTVTGNSGSNGGGILNDRGTATAQNCTIYQNGAATGAGISNSGSISAASLTVSNCTITGNSASGSNGSGGGIYNSPSSNAVLTISSSTISDNIAGLNRGGSIYNNQGNVQIGNTIVKNSTRNGGTILNVGSGVITSAGYNLSSDAGGNALNSTGDQINTDPLLDPIGLRDNGGPTMTIALQAGSPAIDNGKRDTIASLASSLDQRTEPRPFDDPAVANTSGGDGSDIGAYEAGTRITGSARTGNDLQVTFTSILGKDYELQTRTNLALGGWNPLPGSKAGTGGIVPITVANAFSSGSQFYRVHQLQSGGPIQAIAPPRKIEEWIRRPPLPQ
jgi:hypothetical protein